MPETTRGRGFPSGSWRFGRRDGGFALERCATGGAAALGQGLLESRIVGHVQAEGAGNAPIHANREIARVLGRLDARIADEQPTRDLGALSSLLLRRGEQRE